MNRVIGGAGGARGHEMVQGEVGPQGTGQQKLAAALRRLLSGRTPPVTRIDLAPGCAFGVAVDERLKEVERQIGEVKDRVNGLIYLVIGAVVVEVVLRLMR